MTWAETMRTGLQAVFSHRLRSGLTVLGMLIGIATVILAVGLGEGAQAQVNSEFSSLGANLLIVTPGSTTSSTGVRGGFGTASTLTTADADALSSKVVAPDIAGVAPTISRSETLTAGSTNWTTSAVGTTPAWLAVNSRSLAEGRFLTDQDVSQHAAVTVLGSTTAEELFGRRDPIGETTNIAGIPTTVVGVLNPAGSSSSSNQDDEAVVPITFASDFLVGGASRDQVKEILFDATSSSTISAAYQEADAELLALHGITSPAEADFTISPQSTVVSSANAANRTLTVLLGFIAGLSLLVGGIGIMNIMLVSVTERTREIGLRKALGATPRIIRRQFLVEASALGLVGGVLGATLGLVGAVVLPHFISDPIAISAWATGGSIVVAVAIGEVAGIYPASRAARLAPIDALRSD